MNIGIYIYDDAEVLDFSGPFEVFSTAKRITNNDWNVFFVTENTRSVSARGGFEVTPHFGFDHHPEIDVLVVVGGVQHHQVTNKAVIEWVHKQASKARITASVCTGAFILAEAQLLNGLSVTTHWEDIPALKHDYPLLNVVEDKRWVVDGNTITSGGISAGIDMSLYLVSQLESEDLAQATARQMEYRWIKQ